MFRVYSTVKLVMATSVYLAFVYYTAGFIIEKQFKEGLHKLDVNTFVGWEQKGNLQICTALYSNIHNDIWNNENCLRQLEAKIHGIKITLLYLVYCISMIYFFYQIIQCWTLLMKDFVIETPRCAPIDTPTSKRCVVNKAVSDDECLYSDIN